MQLISQPPGSLICGQCCIAMVTGRSLDDVVAFMGLRGNFPSNMRKAASHFGIKLSRHATPLTVGNGPEGKVGVAQVQSKVGAPISFTHWIAWDGQEWYDPLKGKYPAITEDLAVAFYFLEDSEEHG